MGREARIVSLEVNGDVYSAFSPNKYVSGYEKGRRVKVWRERVWGAWYRAGAVQLQPPVRIAITVLRGRAVDYDNLMAACKVIQDGLTAKARGPMLQACLPDDSRKTVTELRVDGVFDAKWKGYEMVTIFVEEINPRSPDEDGGPSKSSAPEAGPAHP